MNIIFLDVDGVLNSLHNTKKLYQDSKRPYSGYDYPFDEKCLKNLKILVEKTNAYIVITSTWRYHEIGKKILIDKLREYDLDIRVIGYTDILHTTRGAEIKAYLEKIGGTVNYIILDDDNDFDDLMEHLIQTNFEDGLTKEDAKVGIKKLIHKI